MQQDARGNQAEIIVITHEVEQGNFEVSKNKLNSLSEVINIASQLNCI